MSNQKYLRTDWNSCLAHAIEECGEFVAAAGKTLRWGPMSVNPELPPCDQESNLVWLRREMKDVTDAMSRLEQAMEREFD